MTTKEKAERALAGKALDGVLGYINRDRRNNLLKLVDVAEKIAGDMFAPESYAGARELIREQDGKWFGYVDRILDELDPHVILMKALNLGVQDYEIINID